MYLSSVFSPLFVPPLPHFFPPSLYYTRQDLDVFARVYTQSNDPASNVGKIGENDEKKKKNDTFYQPQMEHHLSSFQLFYFRAGGFIYCGVIEIAVGRGKNYIETAGASRKLSRLPNGRVKCCVDKSVPGPGVKYYFYRCLFHD